MIEIVEPTGPADIEIMGLLDFDGMVETLESIGGQLSAAWDVIKPSEMSVEIGLEASVETGKLTGLLVSGGGKGSLTVTLTWKSAPK
jgi:hypothetical protein